MAPHRQVPRLTNLFALRSWSRAMGVIATKKDSWAKLATMLSLQGIN